MTLEAAKEMDRQCVMNWLNEVYVTPSRAFDEYTEYELKMFAHDALVLLKEQKELEKRYEPNIMPLTNVMEWMGKSNELREPIYWENRFDKYENQWLLKPENPLYMINAIKAGHARAWTQKPTEEQSKAVKWE